MEGIERKDLPFWFQNVNLNNFANAVFGQWSWSECGFKKDKTGKMIIWVNDSDSDSLDTEIRFTEFGYVNDICYGTELENGDFSQVKESRDLSISSYSQLAKFVGYMIRVNNGRTHNGKTYQDELKEFKHAQFVNEMETWIKEFESKCNKLQQIEQEVYATIDTLSGKSVGAKEQGE